MELGFSAFSLGSCCAVSTYRRGRGQVLLGPPWGHTHPCPSGTLSPVSSHIVSPVQMQTCGLPHARPIPDLPCLSSPQTGASPELALTRGGGVDQAADLDCQSSSRGSRALRVKGGVALP